MPAAVAGVGAGQCTVSVQQGATYDSHVGRPPLGHTAVGHVCARTAVLAALLGSSSHETYASSREALLAIVLSAPQLACCAFHTHRLLQGIRGSTILWPPLPAHTSFVVEHGSRCDA